jgi:hypothetical protein
MTTLENRPNTALLVIDVQNGVVGDAYERDTVVANVGAVVEKARAAEVPVVWVQHSSDNLAQGSEQWEIVPELSPDASELLVQKRYPDSFEETTLESYSTTSPSGASSSSARKRTNACARRCTAHSSAAMTRRSSATRTRPRISRPWGAPPPELVIAHTNLYWGNHEAPGRTAGTVEAKDVDFAASWIRGGCYPLEPRAEPDALERLVLLWRDTLGRLATDWATSRTSCRYAGRSSGDFASSTVTAW